MEINMANYKAKPLLSEKNNGGSAYGVLSATVLSGVSLGAAQVLPAAVVHEGPEATKALSGGTFAYDNVKPIAKAVTTELAGGVSNTFLKSTGGTPGLRRKVNKIEGLDTLQITKAIREGHYNVVTGKFDATYPTTSTDSFGTDDAASPTYAEPGELAYKTGNPMPKTAEYKRKNG